MCCAVLAQRTRAQTELTAFREQAGQGAQGGPPCARCAPAVRVVQQYGATAGQVPEDRCPHGAGVGTGRPVPAPRRPQHRAQPCVAGRRQPAAGDLRLIIAVVKTITDLERIGDEAEKIARMAKLIHEAERLHMPRVDLQHVANLAIAMLRSALDTFARLDSKAAQRVVQQDEAVDSEFRSILRELITFMMEDPRTISRCLEVLFVAKALERIGDHSKNMAEYVIYMVEGRDVRHMRSAEFDEAEGGL